MARYGVQRGKDKHEKWEHLSVLDYKKQERSREIEELTEQAEALEQSNAETQRETAEIGVPDSTKRIAMVKFSFACVSWVKDDATKAGKYFRRGTALFGD